MFLLRLYHGERLSVFSIHIWMYAKVHNGGLTAMESMATRTANMVVNTAAYSEWANGGVHYIKPSNIPLVSTRGLNTIQAQADVDDFILGLERLYTDTNYREYIANAGYALVTREEYTWSHIASRFDAIFTEVVYGNRSNGDSENDKRIEREVYQETDDRDRVSETSRRDREEHKKDNLRRRK